eukprot:TRINITY_DN15816_c0_g1_i1.p1 TRINITY_DN15816_c0_g1~~TRINITY_DN15816_c0_g1_i1.p1  ORF type:complete len:425 (+),score=72.02 TRINITY_DN15816_c0_g1_i1:66-1340(+)
MSEQPPLKRTNTGLATPAERLRGAAKNYGPSVLFEFKNVSAYELVRGKRKLLADKQSCDGLKYAETDLSAGLVAALRPKPTVETFGSCSVMICGSAVVRLIDEKTIIIRNGKQYTAVVDGEFLEFNFDEASDEELTEKLDPVLRNHAAFRCKGQAVPENTVPIRISPEGNLLQEGIGEKIGKEIRSSAHYLAERVTEHRKEAMETLLSISNLVKKIVPECTPGAELRVTDDQIQKAKGAVISVEQASKQVAGTAKNGYRNQAREFGVKIGTEFHESSTGQYLASHRGLREIRRIGLALSLGTDELFRAADGIPLEAVQTVGRVIIEVINHVYGERVADCGSCGYTCLIGFLNVKWAYTWCEPSSLILHSIKHSITTFCENPNPKALDHMTAKRAAAEAEATMRNDILRALGKVPTDSDHGPDAE